MAIERINYSPLLRGSLVIPASKTAMSNSRRPLIDLYNEHLDHGRFSRSFERAKVAEIPGGLHIIRPNGEEVCVRFNFPGCLDPKEYEIAYGRGVPIPQFRSAFETLVDNYSKKIYWDPKSDSIVFDVFPKIRLEGNTNIYEAEDIMFFIKDPKFYESIKRIEIAKNNIVKRIDFRIGTGGQSYLKAESPIRATLCPCDTKPQSIIAALEEAIARS